MLMQTQNSNIFFQQKVYYLAHVMSQDGVKPISDEVYVINNHREPIKLTEVRSFLGMTGYYRWFILNYTELAQPLTRLT